MQHAGTPLLTRLASSPLLHQCRNQQAIKDSQCTHPRTDGKWGQCLDVGNRRWAAIYQATRAAGRGSTGRTGIFRVLEVNHEGGSPEGRGWLRLQKSSDAEVFPRLERVWPSASLAATPTIWSVMTQWRPNPCDEDHCLKLLKTMTKSMEALASSPTHPSLWFWLQLHTFSHTQAYSLKKLPLKIQRQK